MRRPVLASLLGLAALAGCAGSEPEPKEASEAWNLIVLSIDSLRADHLGCYGYTRDTSPAIDALAERSQVFEALSPAPWTLPTHASLMTSLYARSHGVRGARRSLDEGIPTLAEVLGSEGYATAAVVSGPFMKPKFGLGRGFEDYDSSIASKKHSLSHRAVTSEEVHAKALKALDRLEAGGPFFLFLHYWDVHYDYIPPAEYGERFDTGYTGSLVADEFIHNKGIHAGMDAADLERVVSLYDAEIAWVDHHIGLLVKELEGRGLMERTVIVLTADHGDEFFEHGEKGHQHSLYDELLRVPLAVYVPGLAPGRSDQARVSLVDVMPTVLELLNVEAPAGLEGRSLTPELLGETPPDLAIFADTLVGRKKRGTRGRVETWCVQRGQHKLIRFADGRFPAELYNLAEDPSEQVNLAETGLELAARLNGELDRWLAAPVRSSGEAIQRDDPALEGLKGLGYVDGEEEESR